MKKKYSLLFSAALFCMVSVGEVSGLTDHVNGYTWTFTLLDDLSAAITDCYPRPHGNLIIPSTLVPDQEVWLDDVRVSRVAVSSVEPYSLADCLDLTSVEFPDSSSFMHIRSNAISGCSNLVSVTMHEGLASIGQKAFASCVSIGEVIVPKSVQEMDWGVFWGCRGITNMVLPFVGSSRGGGRYGSIFSYIFQGEIIGGNGRSAPFASKAYEGGVSVLQHMYCGYRNYIPSGLRTVTITDDTELNQAFEDCCTLQEINLSNTITNICGDAFENCTGLSQIKIPTSVVHVSGFYGCTGLRAVHTDDLAAWSRIDFGDLNNDHPLYNAHKLYCNGKLVQDLIVPNGVERIGKNAFYGCTSIESLALPESLTSIEYGAFCGCINLNGEVKIPGSVTNICNNAFKDCENLRKVDCGNGVMVLGPRSFMNCGLEEIVISDSVTKLGGIAMPRMSWVSPFNDCENIRNVTINQAVCDYTNGVLFATTMITNITLSSNVVDCRLFGASIENLQTITVHEDNPRYVSIDGVLYDKVERALVLYPDGKSTGINIPDGILKIGDYAFAKSKVVESVTIPNSVVHIGTEAFYECENLTSITIPDSVKYIGDRAFYCCRGLESLSVGNSVTYIGDSAFYHCDRLTSVTLPDSVISIGDNAFEYCWGLTSLNIGNAVTDIGNHAFSSCDKLTSIILPDSVMSIGDYALAHCSRLGTLHIGNSVTNIGEGAFLDCGELTNIVLPDSVENIGDGAFSCCDKIMSIVVEENNSKYLSGNGMLLSKDGSTLIQGVSRDVVIPDGVVEIAPKAFARCSGLTRVEIPASVTNIGKRAFSQSGLKVATFMGNAPTVGDDVFYQESTSKGRKAVVRRDSTGWGVGVGGNWNGLTIIYDDKWTMEGGILYGVNLNGEKVAEIPYGVKTVLPYAFYGCSSELTHLTMSDSVKTIGEYAFCGCDNLESVTIGNSVESIGAYAFYGCGEITSVTIPKSVTSIGNRAFNFSSKLATIVVDRDNSSYASINGMLLSKSGMRLIQGVNGDGVIPNGVVMVEPYAFYGCSGLTSVTIPDSVINIDERAFNCCGGLESAIIGNGVTNIGRSAFWECTNLTSVVIGKSVKSIGVGAFGLCNSLKDVTIPNKVYSIGDFAFSCCYGLTNITIPNSVTSIGDCAFLSCIGLDSFTFEGDAPIIGDDAFKSVANGCTAYVLPDSTGWGVDIPGIWKGINIAYADNYCRVVFDANGGTSTGDDEEIYIRNGGTLESFPSIEREDYELLGWFTAAEGGEQVEEGDVITRDMTLYAHWSPAPWPEVGNGLPTGYLTQTAVRVFKGLSLEDMLDDQNISVKMGGGYLANGPATLCCRSVERDTDGNLVKVTYLAQKVDDGYVKCVSLEFTKSAGGVWARAYGAKYKKDVSVFGTNFSGTVQSLATSDSANGYGLYGLCTIPDTVDADFTRLESTTELPSGWTASGFRGSYGARFTLGANGAVMRYDWVQNILHTDVVVDSGHKSSIHVETYANRVNVNAVLFLSSPSYSLCMGNSYDSNKEIAIGTVAAEATAHLMSFQSGVAGSYLPQNQTVVAAAGELNVGSPITYDLVVEGTVLTGTVTDGTTTKGISYTLPESYRFTKFGLALDGVTGAVGVKSVRIKRSSENPPSVAVDESLGTVEASESGYVVTAKDGETLTVDAITIHSETNGVPVDVTAAYNIVIAEGGKTATVTLNAPQVGVLPGQAEEVQKDEDDKSGLLVEVDDSMISEKPTPEEGEEVGALPVKTYPGLWYQAAWGDDIGNMKRGEKVQATGDTLYLGVIKQTGDKGFYKLSVSEK